MTGWKLHKLVYDAGAAKRYAEAICLAQNSVGAGDAVLVGASHFEASQAWEGLGCHDQAVAEVQASVAARPYGRSGWKETCDLCSRLRAQCDRCTAPHEISEDDVIGKWSGTVETTMRIPADYSAGTPASEDKSTMTETFEVVRRDGQLLNTTWTQGPTPAGLPPTPTPMKLSHEPAWWWKPDPGVSGVLVDRADETASVTAYSLSGERLKVETEMKGHFGGMSVGYFKRVSP